jgi:hypothetical protein
MRKIALDVPQNRIRERLLWSQRRRETAMKLNTTGLPSLFDPTLARLALYTLSDTSWGQDLRRDANP